MCGGLRSTSAVLRLCTLSDNVLLVCLGTPCVCGHTWPGYEDGGHRATLWGWLLPPFTWVLGNGIQVARPVWQEPPLTGSPGAFEAHRLGWAANQPTPQSASLPSLSWEQVLSTETSAYQSAAAQAQAFMTDWQTLQKELSPWSPETAASQTYLKLPFSHNLLCFSNHLLLCQLYKVNTEKNSFL